MRKSASVVLPAFGLASIALTPALGADLVGYWITEGNNVVHIDHCGSALCGTIVGLSPQRASRAGHSSALFHVNPSYPPNKWEGQYYNIDSKMTYRSSFSMRGPNTIDIEVCDWSRCETRNWPRNSQRALRRLPARRCYLRSYVLLQKLGRGARAHEHLARQLSATRSSLWRCQKPATFVCVQFLKGGPCC
jgi:hypothetical protein